MTDEFRPTPRSWPQKFGDAFRGVALGMRGQASFGVHLVCAVGVIVAAAFLRASLSEWCLLLLCITVVFTAEMFNSALEYIAKAIDRRENELLAAALDIASAAVLLAALGAAVVGVIVLLTRLGVRREWWLAP